MEKVKKDRRNVIQFPEQPLKRAERERQKFIKLIFPPGAEVISIDSVMNELERRMKRALALTASEKGYSGDAETESQLFGITIREADLNNSEVLSYLDELKQKGIEVQITDIGRRPN